MDQQYYIARLVYRISCAGIYDEQYEEQWRLIIAADAHAAVVAARSLGRTEEESFTDQQGRTITWQLIAVKDLQAVDLCHGALLASVIKEAAPVAAPLWPA